MNVTKWKRMGLCANTLISPSEMDSWSNLQGWCSKFLNIFTEIQTLIFHPVNFPYQIDDFWSCQYQALQLGSRTECVECVSDVRFVFYFTSLCAKLLRCLIKYFFHNNLTFFYCFSLQDCLRACQEQIEEALATNLPQANPSAVSQPPTAVTPPSKCETGHPTTPTDVRDIVY